MANDSTEEPPSKVTSEDEEHIYEHIYETLVSSDKPELNHQMAMDELITTEANYVHNLQLCIFDICDHLQKKQLPEIDLEGLFSNIDDILQVSKRLLKGLEASVNQGQEQLFHISTLFQELKAEMENVYKIYCGDYDQALLLLDIYSKEPRLQKEIIETLTTTVPHTGASHLSFFLVMPVQRITKYPLLLQKIVENTSVTDSAYGALQAAATAMADVNANINEYKRRKEIADKYNKAGYLTLRERLARINTHSIAKKTARLSRLFMHEAGIVTKTEDKEFDKLEEKFHLLASAITDLKENVACFLDNTQMFLSFKPHEDELDIETYIIQPYCSLAKKLHSTIFPVYQQRLEHLVYKPLCNLSETLRGPQKLIKKRSDKLLDYEEYEEKKNETGSVTYEEEAIMNAYLGINSLLVSELPTFNQVALKWLACILCSFVTLQRDLAKQVLHEAEGEIFKLPHKHLSTTEFWKMVTNTLKQAEDQLYLLQEKFDTVLPSPVVQPLSSAEEKKVHLLLNKHGPDKLYQVTSDTSGCKDMDLPLQRGQIVAFLHGMDSKGNTNRWLVDSGGPRGYVSPGKLQRYHYVPNSKPRTTTLPKGDTAGKMHPTHNIPQTPNPPAYFNTPVLQVSAAYPFTARSNQEVSMQAGQSVTVLEPHDKKGSNEWFLVEVNGQRGYVPSNHLIVLPPQPPGWVSPVWPFPAQ
ncbi:rho guanine nucleotide exchange factor 37 isoform X1 [Ahaetulla prasina]|uniref:rho guanine nucleotide exchange factor 37 isoform X1 n=1 Tax=Ahaetulla prasina TaxID=499056 RepID=UPI0026488A8B|nr:rho guanine nucleotide exchange factor 37 isoform X1 [Ahaetulla prasina]XP_058022620.1 rho guanine nucleotide exchange factor 37 isoform X1 [Ahaetulla prasina]XP_058022621.1 rho guanine nucleotide exchange factor 37 isoform X1 [Ahaetulla prasina]